MIAIPETMSLPLKIDEQGTIYISRTKVTLDILIARYQQGDSPEAMHEGFSTVSLTDIYAVIAYYLAHRDELDAYLKQRDDDVERIRQEMEARYTPEQTARTDYFRSLLAQKRQDEEA